MIFRAALTALPSPPRDCKLCAEGVPLKKFFDGRTMHFDGFMAWTKCSAPTPVKEAPPLEDSREGRLTQFFTEDGVNLSQAVKEAPPGCNCHEWSMRADCPIHGRLTPKDARPAYTWADAERLSQCHPCDGTGKVKSPAASVMALETPDLDGSGRDA